MSVTARRSLIVCSIGLFALGLLSAPVFAADEKNPATQKQVDAIVKSYLVVQKSLAADKSEGVSDALAKIHTAATALSESSDGKLKDQAKSIAGHSDARVNDLKSARAAFKPLSADVIALVQIMPQSAEISPELYDVNCPMAKANWLQTSKDITNPYMGKDMLDCGSIEKKITPAEKK